MAEGSKAGGEWHVRRRRSREYESDDYITEDHGDAGGHTDVQFEDSLEPMAWNRASTALFSGASSEPSNRYRASADYERISSGKKRKSDEISRDTMAPAEAAAAGHSAPKQASSPEPASQSSPTSTGSPSSARSRHRGMSLRSSLFNRNLCQRTRAGDSIIEMQDVSISSDSAAGDKKSTEATVNVRPVFDPTECRVYEAVPSQGQIRLSSPNSSITSTRKVLQGFPNLPHYRHWVQDRARRHIPVSKLDRAYQTARKFVLRIRESHPSKDGRHIPVDISRQDALLDERTGRPFINNFIKSSKYTPWNFLPRQLYAQFSKLANFYFLTVAILQMIPGLSTTGTYTTIIPLMAFVSISMAKEGYEDLRRHRLDKSENNQEAQVLRSTDSTKREVRWESVKWQSLQVGDIVKLERDEAAPADVLLLDSRGVNNVAYIETMALDGETNLKPKQPSTATAGACSSPEAIAELHNAEAVVEDPNLDLYNFEGKISVNNTLAPLTNNEIIYRGSILRNTPSMIGLIVYTGEECKIRMNANKHPRVKAPSLQKMVNKIVIFMVLFVVFLALFNTVAYQIWHISYEDHAWYLNNAHVAFAPEIISFIIMFNTLIPLSLYVSLEIIKVSQMFLMNSDLDMYDEKSNTPFEARTSTINEELGQVGYIFSDKTGTLTENVMKFRKLSIAGAAWSHDIDSKEPEQSEGARSHQSRSKEKRAVRMPFRKSSSLPTEAVRELQASAGTTDLPRRSTRSWQSTRPDATRSELSTTDLIRYIQKNPRSTFANTASMMIQAMALCHTCLPERDNEENISYQASSPDEAALVQAASELGMVVYDREADTLTVESFPEGENSVPVYAKYEILNVIDFSSTRKRMSVIVRFPDGRICVICKGADSVITERLRLSTLARTKIAEIEQRVHDRRSMEAREELRRRSENVERENSVASLTRTSMSLPRPSVGGASLRRLAPIRDSTDKGSRAASIPITSTSTPRSSNQLPRASVVSETDREALIDNITASDDSTTIENCFQQINSFATEGLRTLLYGHRFLSEEEYQSWKKIYHEAITSLSDRQNLIEQAGELIEQRFELTGATAIEDKLQQGVPETIDRLRRANIKLWMLTGDKRETAINIGHSCGLIKDFSTVVVLNDEAGDISRLIASTIVSINSSSIAHTVIVIDGRTLATLQSDTTLHKLFIDLAVVADSVICCRASPSQKAHLVHAIRRRVNRSVTLAIGDGANDIAMIQEAHVGIGITGKEGLQAARTADYAIAQFRFLCKLLLVHGHWNYVRTCKYVLATFWKELLFYLVQATYQRWNGYTGTSLYEQWSLSQFNTLFTSLPVIFLGIFEQDLRPATLVAVPELYIRGQRLEGFNFRVYLSWAFMAVSEAMIVFFTVRGLFGHADFGGLAGFPGGVDLFSLGDLAFSICIIVINCKIQILEQRNKTFIALFCVCLEVGGWFVWNIALSIAYSQNNEYDVKGGFLSRFGRSPTWWLTLLITVAACLLYEITVRTIKNVAWPTDIEVFGHLEKEAEWRAVFERESGNLVGCGSDGRVLTRNGGQEDGEELAKVQTEEQVVMVDDPGSPKGSVEIQEMLSRHFGNVRREELAEGLR